MLRYFLINAYVSGLFGGVIVASIFKLFLLLGIFPLETIEYGLVLIICYIVSASISLPLVICIYYIEKSNIKISRFYMYLLFYTIVTTIFSYYFSVIFGIELYLIIMALFIIFCIKNAKAYSISTLKKAGF